MTIIQFITGHSKKKLRTESANAAPRCKFCRGFKFVYYCVLHKKRLDGCECLGPKFFPIAIGCMACNPNAH